MMSQYNNNLEDNQQYNQQYNQQQYNGQPDYQQYNQQPDNQQPDNQQLNQSDYQQLNQPDYQQLDYQYPDNNSQYNQQPNYQQLNQSDYKPDDNLQYNQMQNIEDTSLPIANLVDDNNITNNIIPTTDGNQYDTKQLDDGTQQYYDTGSQQYYDTGSQQYYDTGSQQYYDGAQQYDDGAQQYYTEHKNIIKIAFTEHKKISIPLAIIIGLIIIIGLLILIYYLYNKISYNNFIHRYPSVDLAKCEYGPNKAIPGQCINAKCSQYSINTQYGKCIKLSQYCNNDINNQFKGVAANSRVCNDNCNNSTVNTQWNPNNSLDGKTTGGHPVNAYSHVWSNSYSGKCVMQPMCKANFIADDHYHCNKPCDNNSGHTSHGECTYNGCPSNHTLLKFPPTNCNEICPSRNWNVFGHSAGGVCTTNCIDGNGKRNKTTTLKTAAGGIKYTCIPKCDNPEISQPIKSIDEKTIKCDTICEYGVATHTNISSKIYRCNDNCSGVGVKNYTGNPVIGYKFDPAAGVYGSQNDDRGHCRPYAKVCGVFGGYTAIAGTYKRNLIGVHGYKNTGDPANPNSPYNNKQKHACNMICSNYTAPNGAQSLGRNIAGGVCGWTPCPNGITDTFFTRCKPDCGNPNIYTSTTVANTKRYPFERACTAKCKGYGLPKKYSQACPGGDAAVCVQDCSNVNMPVLNGIAYKGNYNIAENNLNCTTKATHYYSAPPGGCNYKASCIKNGVTINGNKCNEYCPQINNVTKFGGNVFKSRYNTAHGICKNCIDGVNYNGTGCNHTCNGGASGFHKISNNCVCMKWNNSGKCSTINGATYFATKTWGAKAGVGLVACHEIRRSAHTGWSGNKLTHHEWGITLNSSVSCKQYAGWSNVNTCNKYSIGYGANNLLDNCVSAGRQGFPNAICYNCGIHYGGLTRMHQQHGWPANPPPPA